MWYCSDCVQVADSFISYTARPHAFGSPVPLPGIVYFVTMTNSTGSPARMTAHETSASSARTRLRGDDDMPSVSSVYCIGLAYPGAPEY